MSKIIAVGCVTGVGLPAVSRKFVKIIIGGIIK